MNENKIYEVIRSPFKQKYTTNEHCNATMPENGQNICCMQMTQIRYTEEM